MGDHVPAFLMRELRVLDGAAEDTLEDDETDAVESAAAAAPAAEAADAGPKPRRRRRTTAKTGATHPRPKRPKPSPPRPDTGPSPACGRRASRQSAPDAAARGNRCRPISTASSRTG